MEMARSRKSIIRELDVGSVPYPSLTEYRSQITTDHYTSNSKSFKFSCMILHKEVTGSMPCLSLSMLLITRYHWIFHSIGLAKIRFW